VVRYLPRADVALPVPIWAITVLRSQKKKQKKKGCKASEVLWLDGHFTILDTRSGLVGATGFCIVTKSGQASFFEMTRGVIALWLCSACIVALHADVSGSADGASDTNTTMSAGEQIKEEFKELAASKMSMQSLSNLADKIKSLRTEDKQLQHEVLEMGGAMLFGTVLLLSICCCVCCRKKADTNAPAGHEYEMVKVSDKAFSNEDEDSKMENQIDVRFHPRLLPQAYH
jgi:hypothetical protein